MENIKRKVIGRLVTFFIAAFTYSEACKQQMIGTRMTRIQQIDKDFDGFAINKINDNKLYNILARQE